MVRILKWHQYLRLSRGVAWSAGSAIPLTILKFSTLNREKIYSWKNKQNWSLNSVELLKNVMHVHQKEYV